MSNYSRRSVLAGSAAGLAVSLGAGRLSYAAGPTDRPLLIVLLRGAMDGLGAVPNYEDKFIYDHRRALLPPPPGAENGALPLKDGFALHPSLKKLHAMFVSGEASVLHATAMPSGTRSHFEAQDYMETALIGGRDGWLNRALKYANPNVEAVGIGQNLPLILRGHNKATSWMQATLPSVDDDTIGRLMDMYSRDDLLAEALSEAVALDGEFGDTMMMSKRKRGGNAVPSFKAAANILAKTAGVVTLSLGGWDTHARQGAAKGVLARRLSSLDAGLSAFKTTLGEKWKNTAVIVMTEFGRTVRMNGTKGTDHGTGGVAFLLGGAVRGGQILGEWPGLSPKALYENRDLPIANDLRGLVGGVLSEHWKIDTTNVSKFIFPNSNGMRLFKNNIRNK